MSTQVSPGRAVRLVAAREISTRVRTKSFLISNAVFLVIIVGAIAAAAVFGGGPTEAKRVGLVGSAQSLARALTDAGTALGTPVNTTALADEAAAREQVGRGDLAAALIPRANGGVTALTDAALPTSLRTVLDTAVTQLAVNGALQAQGVDPAQLRAVTAGATVTVDALNPPHPDSGQRTALALVSVGLLYFQLLIFGLAVATGVVEEKTSRVVELLLSTVTPLQLLMGKVAGIGVIGLLQLAAYGVVGLGAAVATGVITITGTAVAVFVGTLGWFVLGYAFFAMLYAAAGSMVSRQEEVGSTTTPLTLLVIAMFFLAQTSVQDPSGTLPSVMAWIPPFSAILMPLRIAAGVASPVQVVGTVMLMVLVTAALAVGAAAIYQRSVLRSGSRVSWRQALGRG